MGIGIFLILQFLIAKEGFQIFQGQFLIPQSYIGFFTPYGGLVELIASGMFTQYVIKGFQGRNIALIKIPGLPQKEESLICLRVTFLITDFHSVFLNGLGGLFLSP